MIILINILNYLSLRDIEKINYKNANIYELLSIQYRYNRYITYFDSIYIFNKSKFKYFKRLRLICHERHDLFEKIFCLLNFSYINTLIANECSIENIPINLNMGIQILDLNHNKISKIENLPEGLRSLNLWSNEILKIENLPEGLRVLDLCDNEISKIENLPEGLRSLNLWSNEISKIENLPEGLRSLNLSSNEISKIENLPEGLRSLNLWSNKISKIENIPEELEILNLWGNNISIVENLPELLNTLYISNEFLVPLEVFIPEYYKDCNINIEVLPVVKIR